ncbi:MAG: hypothetical protein P4K83_02225 [Terracidiphilus sp.]|nr:hypothetical protein [Terracidiphilus sp.]
MMIPCIKSLYKFGAPEILHCRPLSPEEQSTLESVMRKANATQSKITPLSYCSAPSKRTWWNRVTTWSPSEQDLQKIADRIRRIGNTAGNLLTWTVLAAISYLLIEAALAFLPGGPVDRIREVLQ